MNMVIVPLVFITVVFGLIIYANERFGLLSADHFPSTAAKIGGYVWLGLFLYIVTLLIAGSAQHTPTARELAATPFYRLFALHGILVVFLFVWWLLTNRPRFTDFLNIRRDRSGQAVMMGLAIGLAGWLFTILLALAVALILTAAGIIPKNPQPAPMIGYLAAMPVWKKALVVLSAMTIEEAFFRGWLQKRVGLIASTALFALAHTGFGQPLLLIGVAIISLIIGFTFYRTKNLIPGVIAHGVFDAVQLFVIIPVVFKMMGVGGG